MHIYILHVQESPWQLFIILNVRFGIIVFGIEIESNIGFCGAEYIYILYPN